MRKWTYLVAALLMAGATTTFTGCIDNDEPAGIENLRGAKAELLRAKVAVEAAEAARLNAVAEYQKALAAHEQANADFRKAQAKFEEAKAEAEAARTEEEKARIEKMIAQYKQEMENAALTHQATMVGLQQSLAEANREYELALKAIEIAKALMSESQKVTIADLEAVVTTKKEAVDIKADAVFTAEKSLYEAMLDKAQGGVTQDKWIPQLEQTLARDKGSLAADEEALKKLQEFASKDVTTTNWRKEVKVLEDSIKALDLKIADYDVKIAKLENSDEYKTAEKAVTDAKTALDEIATSAYKYTYKFKDTDYPTYGRPEFEVADKTLIKPELPSGAEAEVTDELESVKAQLASYTTQKIAMLDEIAKGGIAGLATSKEKYTKSIDEWKTALEKYSKVGDYNQTKAKTDIAAAGTAYNTAMTVAGTDVVKQNTARAAYAAALAGYYSEADKYVGCVTNEVELDLTLGGASLGKQKKTVAAWLGDTSLSSAALAALMTEKSWVASDFYDETKAIKTLGNKAALLAALKAASDSAFGTGCLSSLPGEDSYMRVEPTETEVLAAIEVAGSNNCALAGTYYSAKQALASGEATNYKALMVDLQAAVTSLTAKLDAMTQAVADAETDLQAKTDAFKVLTDKKAALDTENDILGARKTALGNVKSALITAAGDNLGLDGVLFAGTKEFEEALKTEIEAKEDAVILSQKKVAKSERALKEAQEGKYDAVATAQKDLDEATTELKVAQTEYETALANLKKGLEIMAGTAKN